jgi:Protein of unknown function (DUF429)
MTTKPVLGVGWDVGGWCVSKQGVAAATLVDGAVQWLSSPRAFRLSTGPINTFDQLLAAAAGPNANPTAYRVFLAVDASLAFPAPFRAFLNGEDVPPFCPRKRIENPPAYRFTEREVYRVFRKTPFSGSFDKLGNNATVAMWHLRKWKAADAVRVVPFDTARADMAVAIEVYPALAKLATEEKGRAVAELDAHIGKLRPDSDEYDRRHLRADGAGVRPRRTAPQPASRDGWPA